jgi:ABC-2 type transport system ATP-binding protein
VINLRGVSFGYPGGQLVLREADLEIQPGLSLLVGPNGCGKSTLIKIAAGVEIPRQGAVTVDGLDLWREEVVARHRIAYVPEHPDLTPYATVFEILILVCSLRGQPAAEARDALAWVGLEDLGERTVRELSKGQRRRATLAAARIGEPECLLLDEPLEGMDRGVRDRMMAWLEGRIAAGATAVVVSHDFDPLAGMAHRAATVVDGECRVVDPLPIARERRTEVLERLARGEPLQQGMR